MGWLEELFNKIPDDKNIPTLLAKNSQKNLMKWAEMESPSKGSNRKALLTLRDMHTNTEELKAETPIGGQGGNKSRYSSGVQNKPESKPNIPNIPKIDKKPDKFLGKEVSKGQKQAGNLSAIAAALAKSFQKQGTKGESFHPSQLDDDYDPFGTLA